MKIKVSFLEAFIELLEKGGCYIEEIKGDKTITVDYNDTKLILVKEQPGVYKIVPKKTFLFFVVACPILFAVIFVGQTILQLPMLLVGLAFGIAVVLCNQVHALINKNKIKEFCEDFGLEVLSD